MRAVGARDADLFLLPLALARRLEQAKYRLRHIGIADEHPLHRAHVLRARSPREHQIGGVGIDHVAPCIGDGEPVKGVIGDAAHHRIVGGAVGEANDTGGVGEQVEQPDHGEQRQQPEDIGLGLRPAQRHQRDRGGDDAAGHQQHQHDRAAAPPRLVDGHRLARRIGVRVGGHGGECSLSTWMWCAFRRLTPECLNRTRKRKSVHPLFRSKPRISGPFHSPAAMFTPAG